MSDKPRPGSMAAADAKKAKQIGYVFSAIALIIYLLWLIPSSLYSHYYFSHGGWSRFICIATIPYHFYFTWKHFINSDAEAGQQIPIGVAIWFGLLILNICLLSGFTFNLPPGA